MSMAADLTGKVCLVTGASSGIGRETARGLTRLGAHVLMVGRDAARLEAARDEIVRRAGRGLPEIFVADLSSQGQVRRVAAEVAARHPAVHVLINNAAIITRTRSLTEDGIETQWAVNHLAPFLLTHLLSDRLMAARPSRVVNVASAVEVFGRIDFDDPGREHHYDPNEAYCQSKLANVMFTLALARRLPAGMTANCLHPGAIRTQLLADYYGGSGARSVLVRLRHPGPEVGARASLFLATDPAGVEVTGRYFVDDRPAPTSPASCDVDAQERLWELSERMVALDPRERMPPA